MHWPGVHRLVQLKLLDGRELAHLELHSALSVLDPPRLSVRPVGDDPVQSPVRAAVSDNLPRARFAILKSTLTRFARLSVSLKRLSIPAGNVELSTSTRVKTEVIISASRRFTR